MKVVQQYIVRGGPIILTPVARLAPIQVKITDVSIIGISLITLRVQISGLQAAAHKLKLPFGSVRQQVMEQVRDLITRELAEKHNIKATANICSRRELGHDLALIID